jgi:hypothetical protein
VELALAAELPQFDREAVLAGGTAALAELAAADVVLGTRPARGRGAPP